MKIFCFDTYVSMKKCPLYCERSVSICQTEQELSMVRHKMNQLGTRNFGAYARKMLIDGYIIKVDYTGQKRVVHLRTPLAVPMEHRHEYRRHRKEVMRHLYQD